MTDIARDAFDYLNAIRVNPKLAVAPLQEKLKYFKGNVLQVPGQTVGLMTQEGPAAINECIKFLQSQKPLHVYQWDDGLTLAATDHANDIGPKGITGHTGSDGSSMSDRIERFGEWNGHIGENISFGQKTGQDVILQLIVDDGVPSRGHRGNCFNVEFNLVGIDAAAHKQYKNTCVFDLAEEFVPKEEQQQNQPQKQQQQGKQAQAQPKNGAKPKGGADPNMPPNCVKVNTSTSTVVKNGKKNVTVTTTYENADGSTKTMTETTIQN